MKKYTLLFLLLFYFKSYGQTKKETIDWLNLKLESSPIATSSYQQLTRFLHIKPDGTFIITQYEYSLKAVLPDTSNYRGKTIFTGNFKDLSINSVRTEVYDGIVYFYASCNKGKCIIQNNVEPKRSKYLESNIDVNVNSEVTLAITSDLYLIDRVKKAFVHLITLLGGKKEPF